MISGSQTSPSASTTPRPASCQRTPGTRAPQNDSGASGPPSAPSTEVISMRPSGSSVTPLATPPAAANGDRNTP